LWHAIYDGKDLMVKMGKLVQKFENRFFRNEFLEKMVEQITPPRSYLNYHSNQPFFLKSMAR
jgi:hypothetical protein